MANRKSTASLLVFLGAVLCFFLPFVTISCGGVEGVKLSGQQLASGTSIKQERAFGPPSMQPIDANPVAALAWLSAITGLCLSFAGRKMCKSASFSGGAGVLFLLILRSSLQARIEERTGGMATVHFNTGYVLALLLLLTGAVWNAYLLFWSRDNKILGPSALKASEEEFHSSETSPDASLQ